MKHIDGKFISFIIVVTAFTIYLSMLLAPAFVPGDISASIVNLNNAIKHPFRIAEFSTLRVLKTMGVFLFVEFLFFAYYLSSTKNTRAGAEHGSERLKNPRELNRISSDKTYENNRILTKNIRLSIIGKAISLSKNTLVIGGMGSGKSFFTLIPNILQANTSFIVTDPSRELVRKTGFFLKKIKGYDVKVFDLEDMTHSCKYNFFKYIRNEDDIKRIVGMIFKSTVPKEHRGGTQDPMWEHMAQDLLTAYIAILWYRGKKEEQNIETLIWLMNEDTIIEDAKTGQRVRNSIIALFQDQEEREPGNIASSAYFSATDGAADTIRGVKSTLRGRIGKFLLPSVQNLMSRDELNLEEIGTKKTALFLCVPNEDSSFNFIISLIYAQLFPILYETAKKNPDLKLKIPVQVLIDEMANFVMPDDFISYLTTSRKHEISYMMFFQEMQQIERMFEKEFNTLIGTCNTVVYLGGSGHETNKKFSEQIGNETITTTSFNRSYGRNASFSRNESPSKREVLSPQEIERKIKGKKALCYVQGVGFAIDEKNNPYLHKNFKFTQGEKEGKEFDWTGEKRVSTAAKAQFRVSEAESDSIMTINIDDIINLYALENALGIEEHN